jgi:CheY-like chemotaxis protein
MTKKMQFIWIDDRSERATESSNLEERLNVKCQFKDVKGKDLNAVLSEILSSEEPDLILIDHKLENIQSGIFRTGSTAAATIRERWPECPIVCITGVDMNEVDSQQRSLYEEMYSITKISRYDNSLISIANSFKALRKKRPQTVEQMFKMFKAPKEDKERLKAVFPKELKENFSNNTIAREIFRWTKTTFINRPGFLYDRLWAATLLGIKEDSFSKVEAIFSEAKYDGIFSDDSNERWWKSRLLEILAENISELNLPWEKGRKLQGLSKSDFSKCYATKADFPETVAFVDETKAARRVQIKLNETIPHPNFEDLLFFDEIRMMKPAE